jgi:type IV pilus assembly protein PilM
MRPGRGSPQVAGIAVAPTPPNSFAGDVISDPVMLGGYLKQMLKDAGITANKVVASVSGQTSFAIRPLNVPVMTDKELAESMRWEVERYIPFRPEETIRDFKRLPPVNSGEDSNEMSVLLVAAQKQMIDNYCSALLYAGLTPVALDVEPLSLLRTVPLHEAKNQCIAVVNVGASKTDIGVFDRGVLVYPRSFPIAGNNMTQAVADFLGIPMDQAERLKAEYGEIPEVREQTASPFGQGGGFGPFDLPGISPAEPSPQDFGFGAPAEEPQAAPEPEFDLGGFAAPLDEEATPGGVSFHLDDEEEARPASPGGFSFTLDDEPAAPESAPAPVPPPSRPEPTAFDFGAAPEPEAASGSPVPVTDEERRRRQISDALVPVFNDLAAEVQRSLEYYASRPGGRPVERVYISGGTSRMLGFARALEQDLGIPVQLQDPSRNFPLTGKNALPGYYAEIGPVIALAIGLGARDLTPDPAPEVAATNKPAKKSKAA